MKIFGLAALGAAVTPTQKVIQLLNDMHAKGTKEKQDEEVRFTKFNRWCMDTSEQRQRAVKDGTAKIAQLAAAQQKAEVDAVDFGKKIDALQASIAEWESEIKGANEIREKERSDFQATHVDYSESIDALGRAIGVLKAQSADRAQAESLIQTLSKHKRIPYSAIQDVRVSLEKQTENADFLGRSAPEANAYEFQSGGVVDMLQKLNDQFIQEKRDLESEEANKKHASQQLVQTLGDQIENASSNSRDRSRDKAGREEDAAVAQKDKRQTTQVRDEDQKYLNDLTAECTQKTTDYENRQKLRADELEAIKTATDILAGKSVSGAADTHLPTLAQTSFLQTRSSNLLQTQDNKAKKIDVVDFIRQKGEKAHSQSLMLLATKIQGNPFDRVKKMIWNMIVRLKEEAAAETEHKGWCDTELGVNKVTRDSKTEDIEKLSARKERLESRIAKLAQNIADLNENITSLNKALAEATQQRNEENAKNTQTVQDAKEAQEAVTQAIIVLKRFYDKAATATSLAQTSGPAEDAPETFDKSYQGMQDENSGVVGLLEVIHTDFARLESETSASEAAANREFKQFKNDSELDAAVKKTQVENDEGLKQKHTTSLGATRKDLAGTQEELDAALAYYEKLKPSCVDSGATYEERVAKREEEIQSLKEALAIILGSNDTQTM